MCYQYLFVVLNFYHCVVSSVIINTVCIHTLVSYTLFLYNNMKGVMLFILNPMCYRYGLPADRILRKWLVHRYSNFIIRINLLMRSKSMASLWCDRNRSEACLKERGHWSWLSEQFLVPDPSLSRSASWSHGVSHFPLSLLSAPELKAIDCLGTDWDTWNHKLE